MARQPCPGPLPRREFLRVGTLALGGIGLPQLLAAQSNPAGRAPETSVIFFFMWGGPSQLETWDMKPDAPSEYRGPFQPIHTTVPGMDICELFPLMAKQAHRFSLVRSLHHQMSAHNDGAIEVLTGKTPTRPDPTSLARSEHPDFGMITGKEQGQRPDGLPRYVGIPQVHPILRPNYLGMSHAGFASGRPEVPGYAPPNLTLDAGVKAQRLGDRRHLVGQLDRIRGDLDLSGVQDGLNRFQKQALQLLTSTSVADAFDLNQEEPRLRDRYGRHLWGQSLLLARRLAERGVSAINIDAQAPILGMPLYFSWDDHANAQPGWDMVTGMKWRAKYLDGAFSTLIEDIYARGLDKKILVVAVGEFGRAPRLDHYQGLCGRNHWPQAMSALVCGGGLRMGHVVGATTSKAEYPIEYPLTPQDLLATIYRHLGVDYRREFPNFAGRPIPVLSNGQPIRALI